jgi:hypothetical protein
LKNTSIILALLLVFSACSPEPKGPDEAKQAALEFRKSMRGHLSMCATTIEVASGNLSMVEGGKMDRIAAYGALSQGRATCDQEATAAIMLTAPDGMPEKTTAIYDELGSACQLALQGHVAALDAMLQLLNGQSRPSDIIAATDASKDTAVFTHGCYVRLDSAARSVGATNKELL